MSVAKQKQAPCAGNLDENRFIAGKLYEVADLLDQQQASPFRVRAYRDAAAYIAGTMQDLPGIFETSGADGLEELPTIGTTISKAIAELLQTGDLAMINRLRGSLDPEKLFQTIPMIGPHLAKAIHDELSIDTLEALEAAAYDGRLATVTGIGARRVEGIKHALADVLARQRRKSRNAQGLQPSIADILDVDHAYRLAAATDQLPTISPRRFNASGTVRLPILHTDRGAWHFTAIFSNTPTAQTYKKTRDWVVIYFEQDGHDEGQCTVVTEHRGPLAGLRVVRGREVACASHYRDSALPAQGGDIDVDQ